MKKLLLVLAICLLIITPAFSAEEGNSLTVTANSLTMSMADYPVTPGDTYQLVFFAGSSSVSYTIVVDSSYKIRVANLAVIDGENKTFAQLKEEIEDIVSANYPMSGVQLVIASPATFMVTVNGEVRNTVIKNVSAITRLSDVINGLGTSYASERNVKVTSLDGTEKVYDLFLAKRFGNLEENPYVRPGDVITLSKAGRFVTVNGNVKRPGTYELLDGENLDTLINYYCDGLDPLANTEKILLTRLVDEKDTKGDEIYLSKQDIEKDYKLNNLDTITVSSRRVLKNSIFVQGAVSVSINETLNGSTFRNVNYEFTEGESYLTFVRNHKSWFTQTSDFENAYIRRGEQVISINLYDMIYDLSYNDESLVLTANDILVIPYKQYFVTVSGGVIAPGRYAYVPDKTYDYYVGLAGGFNEDVNKNDAVKITDSDGNEVSKDSVIMPETTIKALKNGGIYNFNKYAAPITTALTILTSAFVVANYVQGYIH